MLSFRMDVCVESASLSSPIAWSLANRMAAMGERLLYDGLCPGNCFSFGTELENRLLVEMSSTRHSEHAQAYWWWSLWFEFGTRARFLMSMTNFGHGCTSRMILSLCYKDFHLSEVKRMSSYITVYSQNVLHQSAFGLVDVLVLCLWLRLDFF